MKQGGEERRLHQTLGPIINEQKKEESMLVRAKFFCEICKQEILGDPATKPRSGKYHQVDVDEIFLLARSDHRQKKGHWSTGDFVLVEVPEIEVAKNTIPSGRPPLPKEKKKKGSSPSDGSGNHQGPTRGQKPHLVVVESLEDENEQIRRDRASVRNPGPRRAARAK